MANKRGAYFHAQSTTPIQVYMNKGDLIVSDTGQGLTNTELSLLTKRFWRKSSQKDGHGLGLSLVKSILEKYSHVIYFEENSFTGLKVIIKQQTSEN